MIRLLAVWLAWDAVTQVHVDGYRIYYGPNSGAQTIPIDVGNNTTGQVTDLPPGVPIYFVIRAYAGAEETVRSNEVCWVEPSASPTPTPTPSPSPTPTPTATPTPTPSPTPTLVRRRLDVFSGRGDGNYYPGTVVEVSANKPRRGYVFDRWDGNWDILKDRLSEATTATMKDRDAVITATYRRK